MKELRPEVEKLFDKCPKIEEYEPILKKLKQLNFIAPEETQIEKMKEDYDFIMDMIKQYPVVELKEKEDKEKKEKKTKSNETSSAETTEDVEEIPTRFI